MTVSTLRPNGTVSSANIALTGAATAQAALNDDSDSSYVAFTSNVLGALTLDIDDIALPSGAVVAEVALRARLARTSAGTSTLRFRLTGAVDASPSITWTTPTDITVATVAQSFTDSQIDAMAVQMLAGTFITAVRVYEVYVDVTYVTVPTTSVTVGTTITDTNLPAVGWTNTLDSDGGTQTRYEVKVFTDAQYGAGGFDANTSSSFETSGIVSSSSASWTPTTVQPDDTYRAYVRVAQTVNGSLHWSDWAYDEYTVSVSLPATPTFSATADNTNARISLAITEGTSGAASTDWYELQRSEDAGTTWETVRALNDDGVVTVPYVVATSASADGNATDHAVTLPTPSDGILADDLLIAFVAADGNPSITWPTGWTELKDEAGNGSAVRAGVAWKRAAGGETGQVTITLSASEGGGFQIYCIRGAHTTTAPEVSTGASAATSNATPDSLNPSGWGTENTLWIAAVANDGDVAVTAAPTGYFDLLNTRWANADGAGIATASRTAAAASEDPGTFTHTAEDTRAFTVGVRPAESLTVYDYEAPNGTDMQYRCRAVHDYNGAQASSAWATDTSTTWTSTSWWLKCPEQPSLNMAVTVAGLQTESRSARQGVFMPLGATSPVVVTDTRGPLIGTVRFKLATTTEQDDLDDLLDAGATLLLQSPSTDRWGSRYLRVSDQDRARPVDMQDIHVAFDTVGWVKVASPSGNVDSWPA